MQHFFYWYGIAKKLLKSGLTLVRTARKNKKFVPKEFLAAKSRPVDSSLFSFCNDFTLTSYVPKPKKSLILLSTMHHAKILIRKIKRPKSFTTITKQKVVSTHWIRKYTLFRVKGKKHTAGHLLISAIV